MWGKEKIRFILNNILPLAGRNSNIFNNKQKNKKMENPEKTQVKILVGTGQLGESYTIDSPISEGYSILDPNWVDGSHTSLNYIITAPGLSWTAAQDGNFPTGDPEYPGYCILHLYIDLTGIGTSTQTIKLKTGAPVTYYNLIIYDLATKIKKGTHVIAAVDITFDKKR